jgi:rfaE bifunctional protein kinase chain/domain
VGDVVADQFIYGEIARISREAPVMILRYESTQTIPGSAGNAAANVAALDAECSLVGFVGRDRPGRSTVLELRRQGVNTDNVIGVSGYTTPTKTRILAGSAHSLRQQVIRIDNEPATLVNDELTRRLVARVEEAAASADAIIISDYNYGAASAEVVAAAREVADRRSIPLLADSRFRLAQFAGFTAATPNEEELERIADVPLVTDSAVLEAGERVSSLLGLKAMLVTRGSKGMALFEKGHRPLQIGVVGTDEAIDVTGAGDTVIATFALALAAGGSFEDAAHLANHAGGLVVMKRGTATTSRQEVLASVLRWLPRHEGEAGPE